MGIYVIFCYTVITLLNVWIYSIYADKVEKQSLVKQKQKKKSNIRLIKFNDTSEN